MNYAHIFNRVYCTPLAISAEGFRAVDAVLRPRLLGKVALPAESAITPPPTEAADGRKRRPRATTANNSAGQTVVTDARLYGLVGPGVAAVPVKGILARNVSMMEEAYCGMAGYDPIAAALQQADQAPEVQEIILDVDSPGGECVGCFELADVIAGLSKPVYGFTEGMATSAAYCLISQCDEIYATRSALLGSIGVVCAVLDDTGNLAADGFKIDYFTAGANKLSNGAQGYTLSDADKQIAQDRVNTYYDMFAAAVAEGRQINAADIEPLAQKSARVYVGQQNIVAGLADGIVSGFDELVQLIVEARTA